MKNTRAGDDGARGPSNNEKPASRPARVKSRVKAGKAANKDKDEAGSAMVGQFTVDTICVVALMWPLQSAIVAAALGASQDFVELTYMATTRSAPVIAAGVIREVGIEDTSAAYFAANPFKLFSWPEIASMADRTDGLPATSDEVH